FSLKSADVMLATVAEEMEQPEASADPAVVRHAAGGLVAGDALARAALATIRDVGAEVGRIVRDTATRVTRGTPVAPLVRALVGAPSASGAGVDGATWAARVADAEQALAIGVRRTTALQEDHERVLAALREARDRERALQAELVATLERGSAEREAITRRADDAVAAAEAQRAAAARDAEAARAALAALQQASLAQRNELSIARTDAARVVAAAEEAQHARDRQEREAHGYRTRLAESQERTRTLEVELARLGEERRRAER